MILVSCSGKFHAFNLAEELNKHQLLDTIYTTYAWQKSSVLMKALVKRVDKEDIPSSRIVTFPLPAFFSKMRPQNAFVWNLLFDKWVAGKIRNKKSSKVFIGWSGMSLEQLKAAKVNKLITILERGSSHILYQNKILKEEYARSQRDFSIDKRVIKKELIEYETADYISVPSFFVKNSFLEYGVPERKLFLNSYGVSSYFQLAPSSKKSGKFIILYLGSLTIRKGLIYMFQALHQLRIPAHEYEVHFIGSISNEIKTTIERLRLSNWKFLGHVPHYSLSDHLSKCDVAVHPSVEEGLSMVIAQMLACGIPVIATTNTGAENIIKDGENGFIVNIRSPEEIAEKIEFLFEHLNLLDEMKKNAESSVQQGYRWKDYGERYSNFLKSLIGI